MTHQIHTLKLSPRKPDVLDLWNELFQKRYQAYQCHDLKSYEQLNNQLKDIRRNGGWKESEIADEFKIYDTLLTIPYEAPVGNPFITYDLIRNGKADKLNLNINQVSIYWHHINSGKNHQEAILSAG